jgi:hypothetical protein
MITTVMISWIDLALSCLRVKALFCVGVNDKCPSLVIEGQPRPIASGSPETLSGISEDGIAAKRRREDTPRMKGTFRSFPRFLEPLDGGSFRQERRHYGSFVPHLPT